MNDYKKNKDAAVAYCRSNLRGINLQRFEAFADSVGKADDAADALLLAMYGMYHRESLTPVVLVPWAPRAPVKKRKRAPPRKSKKKGPMDKFIKKGPGFSKTR